MRNSVWLGLRQLARRPARALLLSIGVATGVAVALGSFTIVQSSQARLRSVLDDLGSRVVLITPATQGGSLPSGSESVIAGITGVTDLAAFASNPSATVLATPTSLSPRPLGVTDILVGHGGITTALNLDVEGRDIRPLDVELNRRVAVLGANIATQMGLTSEALLKSSITVDGLSHEVVGVLKPSLGITSVDTTVFVSGDSSTNTTDLFVRTEPRLADSVSAVASKELRIADRNSPVTIHSARSLAKAELASSEILRWAAVGTSLFAAVVGAVSIASAMNNSVRMRRREIGLQRAFGVSRSHIALAIMVECVGIGLAGGLLGAALGVGTAVAVVLGRGWPLSVNALLVAAVVLVAVGFSALAGVVPGLRAARIDPADSLRSD